MSRLPSLGTSLVFLAAVLSGCSAVGTSNQVVVHLEEGGSDLGAAQRVADEECRRRGGRARFVLIVQNTTGSRDTFNPLPPDAVFACDPAP